MDSTTLKIFISAYDLAYLMEGKLNLCLTRDVLVEGDLEAGNVVFSSVLSKDLGPHITFQWKDIYQVFGVIGFKHGKAASEESSLACNITVGDEESAIVETDVANVETGQEATMNLLGNISVSGSISPGKAFVVNNEWKNPARMGVKFFDAIDKVHSPTFISIAFPLHAAVHLLPSTRYAVFFDPKLVAGTMFETTVGERFCFDVASLGEITLSYIDGVWKQGEVALV